MARSKNRKTEPEQAAKPAVSGIVAIAVGVLIALAVVFVMLYGPLCDWYGAWRSNMRLSATYAEVLDENAELQSDVDHLRTREGIEDEARRQGLVGEGETRVVVENYPEEDTEPADAVREEVYDDPWYLLFLDSVFGFEG